MAWLLAPRAAAAQDQPAVPFVPTPDEIVRDILQLGGTTGRDTVYDLGSGDGRIPIVAARDFGAAGVGVELDSALVALSRARAREAGVEERVRFVRGDLFEVDLSPATVLTLYLNTLFNLRLRPRILEEMRPGTRVVSHVFDMGQWPADTVVRRLEFGAFLYRWTVPADVEGRWRFSWDGGRGFVAELDQKFQAFCSRTGGGAEVGIERGEIRGEAVEFVVSGLPGRAGPVRFRGTADGEGMGGRTGGGGVWSATRIGTSEGSRERWETGEPGGEPPDGCVLGRGR